MEKTLLELNFHLRKPYNEAKKLIEVFNQIIEEGGRCEICIQSISSDGYVLKLNLYRCRNSFVAASLGAQITDKLVKENYSDITKFNFASAYYCPIIFSLASPIDKNHGQTICISLFENANPDVQNSIHRQFKLIELSATQ